jgi:hypothetical protein
MLKPDDEFSNTERSSRCLCLNVSLSLFPPETIQVVTIAMQTTDLKRSHEELESGGHDPDDIESAEANKRLKVKLPATSATAAIPALNKKEMAKAEKLCLQTEKNDQKARAKLQKE